MTRDEALYKLIAIEPATDSELIRCTGWPPEETRNALQRLREAGRIGYWNKGHRQLFHIKQKAAEVHQ
jgi:predicted Rossmann fold nucleotide-binding protein DprA/Smf involved in DNA uptake